MRHRSAVFPVAQVRRAASPWISCGLIGLTLLLGPRPLALAQHQDLSIYSTQEGTGMLVASPNPSFENPVFESLCIGGFCLYSSTDPGLITPSQGGGGLFALKAGTPVSFELVAADASVSIKIGSTVLSTAGASALLGTAPSLHVHPTYQVQRPAGPGQFGGFPFSFRFKATGYGDSPVYQMTLSNQGAAPTPTPSPVPTPSPSPPPTPAPSATASPNLASPTPRPTTGAPPPTPGATLAPTPRPSVSGASETPAPLPSATLTPAPGGTVLPSPTGSITPTPPTPGATASPTPRPAPTPTAPVAQPSPTPGGSPLPLQPGSRDRLRVVQPGARGDQVVLFYDARDGFRSFLSVANEGEALLLVELLLYGDAMEEAHALLFDLPPGGTRTIDVEAERERGLAPVPGVAFATAVRDDGRPVVSRALSGSLSVANLATSSSWGAAGAARLAFYVNDDQARLPALGRSIDGTRVRLQRLAPDVLHLPVFYDPSNLEAATSGGSQLAFVSFRDISGPVFAAAGEESVWRLRASHQSGAPIPPRSHATRGVELRDLASVLGVEIAGAGGRVELRAEPPVAPNRLVYFIQALGPFAMGYPLPAVEGSLDLELR